MFGFKKRYFRSLWSDNPGTFFDNPVGWIVSWIPGYPIGDFKKHYMVIRWRYRGRYLFVKAHKVDAEKGTIKFKTSFDVNETNYCVLVAFFITIKMMIICQAGRREYARKKKFGLNLK